MAQERNGFITARPEDFVKVTGAPYYPARIMGEEGDHLVPTNHWYVVIDSQPWMQYGFAMGRIKYICEMRDKLNVGEEVDENFKGARFAVGPAYYWSTPDNGMRRMNDRYFPYSIWINRLPNFESQEVVEVQEIYI